MSRSYDSLEILAGISFVGEKADTVGRPLGVIPMKIADGGIPVVRRGRQDEPVYVSPKQELLELGDEDGTRVVNPDGGMPGVQWRKGLEMEGRKVMVVVAQLPPTAFRSVLLSDSNPPQQARNKSELSDSLDCAAVELQTPPSSRIRVETGGVIKLPISNWVRGTRFAWAFVAICILGVFLGTMARFYVNSNTRVSSTKVETFTKTLTAPQPTSTHLILEVPSAEKIPAIEPAPANAERVGIPPLRTGADKPTIQMVVSRSEVDKNI
jgi:hypothetical protein